MTKIVSGFDKAHLDAIYAGEYKLYDKMVELNILQTNGKLTAEFKNYLQILLQDASKNSENIMDKILSPGNLGIVATFAEFLGLSNEEFSDICSSENRRSERNDLIQMGGIVKLCLLDEMNNHGSDIIN
jgi:hypothetical protein